MKLNLPKRQGAPIWRHNETARELARAVRLITGGERDGKTLEDSIRWEKNSLLPN
jgi:hypothetical protein